VAAVRYGASGRQRTFDRLADGFFRGKYDPANFALRLAHMVLEEMTEAPNRGWADRDSRSPMLLQEERAGVQVRADEAAIAQVLEKDPPAG